jgi:hypothetical protein
MQNVASANALGVSVYKKTDLAATKQEVKDERGAFYGCHVDNTANAAKTYIQFFDADADDVTVGTTVSTWTFVCPGSGGYDAYLPFPIPFSNALTIAATTTSTGNTAAVSAILIDVFYA